ncbi:MAG: PDZ domain-containing protein, partial [Acidimicrobiales bacterium]
YSVPENDQGAQVDLVVPSTAASAAGMQCDDLITAIDGTPIHTDAELGTAIRAHQPGDTITVTVSRSGQNGPVSKELTAKLTGTPASAGQAANANQAFLGVASETRYDFQLPFPISYEVGDIGGPSAGLALTLGILDSLSGGNLFAGHRIAATGTMDLSGDVGDVGGVTQKTVAVRRAGAQIFFVPVQEYKTAKKEAGPHLEIRAVSSLTQVIKDLSQIGGTLSKPVGQPA